VRLLVGWAASEAERWALAVTRVSARQLVPETEAVRRNGLRFGSALARSGSGGRQESRP